MGVESLKTESTCKEQLPKLLWHAWRIRIHVIVTKFHGFSSELIVPTRQTYG